MIDQAKSFHAAYVRATGLELPMNRAREYAWQRFIHAGFTIADVVQVVGYLKREIRDRKRNDGCLKFSNLIDADNGFERFEEDLALARKLFRTRPAPRTEAVTAGDTTVAVERDPAAEAEPEHIRDAMADSLSETVRKLKGDQ